MSLTNSTIATSSPVSSNPATSSSVALTSIASILASSSPSSSSTVPPSSTLPPSTTTTPSLPPSTTPTPSQVVLSSAVVVSQDGSTKTVVFVTTQPAPTPNPTTTSSGSASSTAPAALDGSQSQQTNAGLSSTGKTAIAVVVPIVVVALLILAALFFWRKRKQRKDAEELRRKEVEEYGYNPNADRGHGAVGATSDLGDGTEMKEGDGAGYRGWGTTTAVGSTAHKTSTTMSSANGPIGMARSDSGSQPGAYHAGVQPGSDKNSNEPLVSPMNSRPDSGEQPGIGALGGAPAAMNNRQPPKRGPSNASSAYSAGNRSDVSAEEAGMSPRYYNDGLYHDEAQGPYDGSWSNAQQPVIRDVSAKRNTRIESPSVFPQQGNAGIAQNF